MFFVRYVVFTFVPFSLVIVMYSVMIWRVRVEKLNSRRMLLVTFLVIFTGLVAWFPSIIANFGNINMNYEVSQIFTVTLFYLNGVSDPIIYILGYPSVKNYLRDLTNRGDRRSTPHISSSLQAALRRSETDLRTVGPEGELSTVSPPCNLQPRFLNGSFNSKRSRASSTCEPEDRSLKKSFKNSLKRSIKSTFKKSLKGSSKRGREPRDSPKFRRFTASSKASSHRSSLRNLQNTPAAGSLASRRGSLSVTRLDHCVSPADIIQMDCLKDCTVVQNSPDSISLSQQTLE